MAADAQGVVRRSWSRSSLRSSLRLRSTGDFQGFVELGAGVGHLIYLSADQQFENPARRGRG